MTRRSANHEPFPPDDFGEWSLSAQQALLMNLAADALRQWGLKLDGLSWLTYSTNAVFAVYTAENRYVLRLSLAGRVSESRLRSELDWLRAIRQRTDLLAPNPVVARGEGEEQLYAMVSHELLPPPRFAYCALFEFIEGAVKGACDLSAADMHAIGRYLGRLHQDAQFDPSPGFDRPRLGQQGLFGADSPYQSANRIRTAAAEQGEVFAKVAQRVGQVMARLEVAGESFGLIHADLLAKNVLFSGAAIAALDFEYSGWGYFLYDLAPLLWQLRGERSADYALLEEALLAGYRSARAGVTIDRDALEAFVAARQLASCRWLLQNLHQPQLRDAAPDLIRQRMAELGAYISSGELRRQSPTL